MSELQFNSNNLLVNEGILTPREYIRSDMQEEITFLFNGKNITLPVTYYNEQKADTDFKVNLAFLNHKNFPIQTHAKYITDSKYYFSGYIFRLVSVETK